MWNDNHDLRHVGIKKRQGQEEIHVILVIKMYKSRQKLQSCNGGLTERQWRRISLTWKDRTHEEKGKRGQ